MEKAPFKPISGSCFDSTSGVMVDGAKTDEEQRTFEFDDIFEHVSSLGKYQIFWLVFTGFVLVFPVTTQFTLLVFANGTPDFHCVTPNVTCEAKKCCKECTTYEFDGPFHSTVSEVGITTETAISLYQKEILRIMTIEKKFVNKTSSIKISYTFALPNTTFSWPDISIPIFKWNLICDRDYLGATLQSVYFAGMLVGSFVTGMISDAWGRKKCIFISNAVMVSLCSTQQGQPSFHNLLLVCFFWLRQEH